MVLKLFLLDDLNFDLHRLGNLPVAGAVAWGEGVYA